MKITIKQFNKKYPVGTKVLYFPVFGRQDFKKATTTSGAYEMCTMPMVGLDIGGGGYCLRNIEIDN